MPKKPPSPPRHPPNDAPKITDQERKRLSKLNRRLRPEEAELLLQDRRRRQRKRLWLSEENPPDRRDREHSLSVSDIVATPKEEDLMRMGVRYSERQSEASRRPRINISPGESLVQVFQKLAQRCDALGDGLRLDDLWAEFFSILDENDLDPREVKDGGGRSKKQIQYQIERGARRITFKTFANQVYAARKALRKKTR